MGGLGSRKEIPRNSNEEQITHSKTQLWKKYNHHLKGLKRQFILKREPHFNLEEKFLKVHWILLSMDWNSKGHMF